MAFSGGFGGLRAPGFGVINASGLRSPGFGGLGALGGASNTPAPTTPETAPLPPPPPPPPGANTPVAQQATIPTNTSASTTNVNTPSNVQQLPLNYLQEILMGMRYNNPYISGVSGPYQMPQYAGLQNIAPWAMPQNPSMYGGGFGMPYQQLQPSAPNMNNLLSAFLGAWR